MSLIDLTQLTLIEKVTLVFNLHIKLTQEKIFKSNW